MAFLNNSGSILLDAVLTDLGRNRLAQGNGSFKITKFAFFDDEIDYALYNSSHASGSAYYDLSILQTPVLEAFTNNTSFGRSKLLSIARSNLLYLPVVKINNLKADTKMYSTDGSTNGNIFVLAVDDETEIAFTGNGVLQGETQSDNQQMIRLDQGLDTTEYSYARDLEPDLKETQYIVEIDNRFASIVNTVGVSKSYVLDDDGIAMYLFTLSTDPDMVSENTNKNTNQAEEIIAGPKGTILKFKLRSSLEVNTSHYLFRTLGTLGAVSPWSGYRYIDTNIRVTGGTTGYTVDIPLRLLKKV